MKLPHLAPPYARSNPALARAEAAERSGHVAVRLSHAKTGAGGHVNDHAGLVAVFGRRRALDHFHGLYRVQRNLVREDFALLIRDRLAIERERVRRVIAQSVKQAVRIGGNAG